MRNVVLRRVTGVRRKNPPPNTRRENKRVPKDQATVGLQDGKTMYLLLLCSFLSTVLGSLPFMNENGWLKRAPLGLGLQPSY